MAQHSRVAELKRKTIHSQFSLDNQINSNTQAPLTREVGRNTTSLSSLETDKNLVIPE